MLIPRQPIAEGNACNEEAKERPRLADPDQHRDERRDLEGSPRDFAIHETSIGSWVPEHEVLEKGPTRIGRLRPGCWAHRMQASQAGVVGWRRGQRFPPCCLTRFPSRFPSPFSFGDSRGAN